MIIIKRLFLFISIIIAVLIICWFFLRVSLGERGCSIDTKWVDEKELKNGIKKIQFYKSNVIQLNYLTPNFNNYKGGEYISEAYVFGSKNTKIHINNLNIRYIFGNEKLQPSQQYLARFNNKAELISNQILQSENISNIYLNNGEKIRITYIFDEDDVVFNKGELFFTYEYTKNELSSVIDRKISLVKNVSKYNCLW